MAIQKRCKHGQTTCVLGRIVSQKIAANSLNDLLMFIGSGRWPSNLASLWMNRNYKSVIMIGLARQKKPLKIWFETFIYSDKTKCYSAWLSHIVPSFSLQVCWLSVYPTPPSNQGAVSLGQDQLPQGRTHGSAEALAVVVVPLLHALGQLGTPGASRVGRKAWRSPKPIGCCLVGFLKQNVWPCLTTIQLLQQTLALSSQC